MNRPNRSGRFTKVPTGHNSAVDTVLIYLLMSKLDTASVLKWQEGPHDTVFPRVEELFMFLHDRCKVLEPVGPVESAVISRAPV